MPRLPRLVLPGIAYHLTQRGNRREKTFFENDDFALYRDLVGEAARRASCQVISYCLMPNHVHLIVVPAAITRDSPEDQQGRRESAWR